MGKAIFQIIKYLKSSTKLNKFIRGFGDYFSKQFKSASDAVEAFMKLDFTKKLDAIKKITYNIFGYALVDVTLDSIEDLRKHEIETTGSDEISSALYQLLLSVKGTGEDLTAIGIKVGELDGSSEKDYSLADFDKYYDLNQRATAIALEDRRSKAAHSIANAKVLKDDIELLGHLLGVSRGRAYDIAMLVQKITPAHGEIISMGL